MSNIHDFVKACISCVELQVPFGIYNITNHGWVLTEDILKLFKNRKFNLFESDDEFYKVAKTPRSNAILDTNKISSTGIYIRNVDEALYESINRLMG